MTPCHSGVDIGPAAVVDVFSATATNCPINHSARVEHKQVEIGPNVAPTHLGLTDFRTGVLNHSSASRNVAFAEDAPAVHFRGGITQGETTVLSHNPGDGVGSAGHKDLAYECG